MGKVTWKAGTFEYPIPAAMVSCETMEKSNIIISEVIGCDKHHANGFQLIMRQNPNCSKFFYIGDNTSKDFYWPNKLGWTTICLKDNGKNIHQQNFDIEFEYKPQHIIHNFSDIIPLIL